MKAVEIIRETLRAYRKTLRPAKRFADDFMLWNMTTLILFDREPTEDEMSDWFNKWIKNHHDDAIILFPFIVEEVKK